MIGSCSIIIRKPYGAEGATLGIRAAWAMFTNASIDIKLLLMGDGVYSVLGKEGYVKNLYARFIGEGGEVYALKEDMEARGVEENMLPEGTKIVEASDVFDLIDETESVLTF